MVTAAMKLKDTCKESYHKPRQHIKKQRHHFADKDLYSQSYGFSSSPVQMWELDHKQGWVLKNGCFQTLVLENTPDSPLDWKEIKPVNTKEMNPEYSLEGLMLKLILWPPDRKSQLTGKDPVAGIDWRQKEKEAAEGEMVR